MRSRTSARALLIGQQSADVQAVMPGLACVPRLPGQQVVVGLVHGQSGGTSQHFGAQPIRGTVGASILDVTPGLLDDARIHQAAGYERSECGTAPVHQHARMERWIM
ncbi:MAG: hypothetical protein DI635_03680 [Pseudoxanthomonas suwonensis]|nr:MAG: hypothetical protein DI635_03680 [Pseudoxanthomonas suwonensis]